MHNIQALGVCWCVHVLASCWLYAMDMCYKSGECVSSEREEKAQHQHHRFPEKKKHDRRMSSKKAWPKTLTIISVWLIKHTNSTIKVRLMQNLCLTNLNIFQNQNQHFTNAKVVEAYLATNKLH